MNLATPEMDAVVFSVPVTGGEHRFTASRVAPDLAMGRLEARFGMKCEAYLADRECAIERVGEHIRNDLAPGQEAPSIERADVWLVPTLPLAVGSEGHWNGAQVDAGAAARLARQLETCEQVAALFGEHSASTHAVSAARARLAQIEAAEARAAVATTNFASGLTAVYRESRCGLGAVSPGQVRHPGQGSPAPTLGSPSESRQNVVIDGPVSAPLDQKCPGSSPGGATESVLRV